LKKKLWDSADSGCWGIFVEVDQRRKIKRGREMTNTRQSRGVNGGINNAKKTKPLIKVKSLKGTGRRGKTNEAGSSPLYNDLSACRLKSAESCPRTRGGIMGGEQGKRIQVEGGVIRGTYLLLFFLGRPPNRAPTDLPTPSGLRGGCRP